MNYEYRPDGMFLCRCICGNCHEQFDIVAVSNHRDLCPACEAVKEYIEAEKQLKQTQEQAVQRQVGWDRSKAPQWFMLGLGWFLGVASWWIFDIIRQAF